jgi:hypothetical protein
LTVSVTFCAKQRIGARLTSKDNVVVFIRGGSSFVTSNEKEIKHSALWQLGDASIKSLQQNAGLVLSFD